MENEIKVNEFIRTKKHGIFKVETIRKTPYGHLCGTTDNERVPTFTIGKGGTAEIKNDIVKHSPNLIDLIQCGDYVNGKLIHKVDIRKNSGYIYYGNGKTFTDYQIETVATKEQFESISYKVRKM